MRWFYKKQTKTNKQKQTTVWFPRLDLRTGSSELKNIGLYNSYSDFPVAVEIFFSIADYWRSTHCRTDFGAIETEEKFWREGKRFCSHLWIQCTFLPDSLFKEITISWLLLCLLFTLLLASAPVHFLHAPALPGLIKCTLTYFCPKSYFLPS